MGAEYRTPNPESNAGFGWSSRRREGSPVGPVLAERTNGFLKSVGRGGEGLLDVLAREDDA